MRTTVKSLAVCTERRYRLWQSHDSSILRPVCGSVLASPSRRKTVLHITRLFSAQQFQSEIFVAILVLRLRNMNGLRKVCLSSTPPTVVPASNLNQGTNNIQVKVLGTENLSHQRSEEHTSELQSQ